MNAPLRLAATTIALALLAPLALAAEENEGDANCIDEVTSIGPGRNNWCQAPGTPITCNDPMHGTSSLWEVAATRYRDLDWYTLELPDGGDVAFLVTASTSFEFRVYEFVSDCGNGLELLGSYSGAGGAEPLLVPTTTLPPGTYRVLMTNSFGSVIACGSPYVIDVQCGDPCPGDLSGDGSVGFADLNLMLGDWGPCPSPCASDLTDDGTVGFADLNELLTAWGACA